MAQANQLTIMAADAMDTRVLVTSRNVAFLLFGRTVYSEYLDFQNSIVLPRNRSLYKTKGCWIFARDTVQSVAPGHLPNVRAYWEFKYWLHESGKLHTVHETPTTTLSIAKRCGHGLHPAIASVEMENSACPICTIKHAASALSSAWSTWKILGAPDRRPPFEEGRLSAELYYTVKSIWRSEKKQWLSLVHHYEKLEKDVAAWEEKEAQKTDPSSAYMKEELNEAKSVGEALQFARENDPHRMEDAELPFVPHPVSNRRARSQAGSDDPTVAEKPQKPLNEQNVESRLSLTEEPPSPPHSPASLKLAHTASTLPHRESYSSSSSPVLSPPRSPNQVKKAVKFAVDVMEHKARNGFAFKRNSATYSPGRHAAPSKAGWADTSFWTKRDFQYDNELVDLDLELQRLEAFFKRIKEDRDSTVGDDSVGDTESDTDSGSDSDSNIDLTEEEEDFKDPLAEAILLSLEMEMDPVDETDRITGSDLEAGPGRITAPSRDGVQTLDALSDLSDAGLRSLLSTSGLCHVPSVAGHGPHTMEDFRSPGGAVLQANEADTGLGRVKGVACGEVENAPAPTDAEDDAATDTGPVQHRSDVMGATDAQADPVSRDPKFAIEMAQTSPR